MIVLYFIAATAVAVVLVKLGALSVWVAVLQALLATVLGVALFGALFVIWRRYRG